MSALKSALRILPAALAVSFLSGCGWYRAAWEAEQGGRPHNHGAAAQSGDAKDDGNTPTPPEAKPDEPRADETKPDEPAPESKAQRKAREKAERERLKREEAERDSLERDAQERAQAQAQMQPQSQAQPQSQPQTQPQSQPQTQPQVQLQSSDASHNPAPESAMNADHSETEAMRAWRMGQQRLDLMLKFSSSDDHLVAIMLASDNADLSYARMAYTRATTREVKAFAQRMINDHSQAVALINEIVARNDISPKDNLVSRDLRDEATGQRETMRPLTGVAFDSAYVANEVAYHHRLISMIDDVLLPRLDDGELRQQLTTMRPVLVAHLAHAEQIQATLAHH